MSKYTTEVRFICETYAGLSESTGYDDIEDVISASRGQIFKAYPIFDEAYRATLETKILMHYYTREICEETVGLWKLRLNARMNEIMPYYNQLYSSQLYDFNPFYDVDLTTTHNKDEDRVENKNATITDKNSLEHASITDYERNTTGESSTQDKSDRTAGSDTQSTNDSSSSQSNSTSSKTDTTRANVDDKTQYDLFNDTPQGGLSTLDANTYLTNARKITGNEQGNSNESMTGSASSSASLTENGKASSLTNENESTSSTTSGSTSATDKSSNAVNENTSSKSDRTETGSNNITTTEGYLEHVQGKRGSVSFSKLLLEYRETFINIDKMIIEELRDLFFGLWE